MMIPGEAGGAWFELIVAPFCGEKDDAERKIVRAARRLEVAVGVADVAFWTRELFNSAHVGVLVIRHGGCYV